jgi:hypothetical protein
MFFKYIGPYILVGSCRSIPMTGCNSHVAVQIFHLLSQIRNQFRICQWIAFFFQLFVLQRTCRMSPYVTMMLWCCCPTDCIRPDRSSRFCGARCACLMKQCNVNFEYWRR